jgi:hypothetical protein
MCGQFFGKGAMTAVAVSQLLHLFDEAFEGSDWNSLLANLRSVTPDDWLWVAPGGKRSIREIVQHVGACKFMYQDQAFGDGQISWDEWEADGHRSAATVSQAVEWLRQGHARLRQSIAALDDSQLLRLRPHHSGVLKETRWIISMMIQHDLYHAGEINYIRALHQGNDE